MKYTLLEITQAVLSSMDSDEVSSINDTVESQQVVEVIKTVYDDIISRGDLQTNKILFNLTPSNDNTKPTYMSKPAGIDRIMWIKYNVMKMDDPAPVWAYLTYLQPNDFIDMMHSFNQTEDDISNYTYTFPDGSNINFIYKNDAAPLYYTTFDDNVIFFDSYDNTVDTTLTSAKTLCYGTRVTDFQKVDSFVPNLQPQQFSLLINEAKSLAWAELKQAVHQKAEASARKNWLHLQKTRNQIPDSEQFMAGTDGFTKLPNFSRKR